MFVAVVVWLPDFCFPAKKGVNRKILSSANNYAE
jgi:hypothetical protein|tara:strand:+ start:11354 stop:11455 length:102 start_codon:yes stop_codon:yes gene_type:complete